jgi:hypothetical protein
LQVKSANCKIAYLEVERDIILKCYQEETGRKRMILTDEDRAKLGRLGGALGYSELKKLNTYFKPDTVMR